MPVTTPPDGSPFSHDGGGGGLDSPSTTPTSQYNNGTPSNGGDGVSSTLLREHQAEFERLKIDSFNQALRINFLEERLLRYKHGTAFESEDLENEVFQMRLSLQERENELKHKSLTIVRATEYMKSLQDQLKEASAEIERLRTHQQQQRQQPAAVAANNEVVAQFRVELQHAHERDQGQRERIKELEEELGSHQDTVATMTAKHHELLQAHAEKERDMERLRQALQKAEAVHSNAGMEVEQWRAHAKQRDEEITRLREQFEKLGREKEHVEARYQSKLKRMDEQVQAQMEQLKRESENYRVEHTRILTEREKSHFERERIVMEADTMKQEKARLQIEIERLAKELDRATGEAESLRLQNVKLTATCEHKTQTLESYKTERENAMESFHKMETELRQWRSVCTEREMTIKTLDHRAQLAEDEAKRMTTKLEMLAAHNQQTSNERLLSLEKDRHTIEQDNFRLRKDLATLQHELESLEMRFNACDKQLTEESARSREYQERHAQCERELQQRSVQLEESEHRLAEVNATMSSSESAILQQQAEHASRFAAEKSELLQALQGEQEHADSLERNMAELEKLNGMLMDELQAIESELSAITRREVRVAAGDHFHSIMPQLREAITSIQREFKAECAMLEKQWRQQTELMEKQLDQLSNELHSSQGKLEILQRTTVHVKDDKQTAERTWAMRYEKLRLEKESERRALEAELREYQSKATKAETFLVQAKNDLESLTRAKDSSRAELERDYRDLKESNRLLYEEVQERRRAADHARKQCMSAVKENKDLLAAIDVYKNAIADREKDIEYYKAALMKSTQQLQRRGGRVSMGEVKQTLLEQLEQTQYMINETYKRWSDSELGGAGLPSNNNDQEFLHQQNHNVDVTKKRGSLAPSRASSRRSSTTNTTRNGAHGIYRSSLSSLGRIDSELQEIEKKIKSYQE